MNIKHYIGVLSCNNMKLFYSRLVRYKVCIIWDMLKVTDNYLLFTQYNDSKPIVLIHVKKKIR